MLLTRLPTYANVPNQVTINGDVTAPTRDGDGLRSDEERYRALFNLGPVAVYSRDTAGVIQEFNRCAVELWGCEPVLGDTDKRFCGSFKLFRPDGTYMPHEECPMAEVVAGTLAEAGDGEVVIERSVQDSLDVWTNRLEPLFAHDLDDGLARDIGRKSRSFND